MGSSQERDTLQESVPHQLAAIQAIQAQLWLNLGARGKSDRGNRAAAQRLVEPQTQEREARQHAALTDLFGGR